jgi:hypothetical protein
MEPIDSSTTRPRSGISTHIVEAAVAVCIIIMGLVVMQSAYALGSGWTSEGPGSGYFPFWIGTILCIAGAGTLYQTFFGKSKNTEIFVDSDQLKRVLQVLIPAMIYVGATQLVGLYVASAVYIAGFMIVLGHYSWKKSLVVAISVVVLFFLMFEVWFKVPLFKGMFNLLSFVGY